MGVVELAWGRLPEGYTAEYTSCDGGVYWHLLRDGERVNGGLSCDEELAYRAAVDKAWFHKAPDHSPDPPDLDLTRRYGPIPRA